MVKIKKTFATGAVEMRAAYCAALMDAAKDDPRIFVLDCDLVSSMGDKAFAQAFPHRHLNCGIQEANACGVAAGLSRRGFVPFVHSFGVFASRRIIDQIYISCAYAGLNVKITGADPGITAASNGGTHMAMEDAGILRVVPGVTIVEPTDAVMMYDVTRKLIGHYGVDYMRMARKAAISIYEEGSTFELGKGVLLREGCDVTLIACGLMVYEALKAADQLSREGIRARVVDMFTIKPIDCDIILESAQKTGAIVTAENHNIIGGLGSAVAEALSETCPCPMERVGVRDQFGEVGSVPDLQARFGLTAEEIARRARTVIARKTA